MRHREDMASFWDARAVEDAFYFVDNRLTFGEPDEARFWEQGREDLATLLDVAGSELSPNTEVVEIGCGLGRLTRALAERCAHVEALDVSAEMLRRARSLNPTLENVTWLLGDGTSLRGVEAASADLCVSHVVFQHLPDPAITLGYVTEMGRVLRPGGSSVFQVSTDPSVHSRSALARGRTCLRAALSRGPRGQTHPAWLGSAVSLVDLERTAVASGLDVDHVFGAGTQHCVVRLTRRLR